MICPVCSTAMVSKDFGGITVDVCADGCKGLWFDWAELIKVDEKHEGFGEAIKEALESSRVNTGDRGGIDCPKCGISMHMHKYKSAKSVTVDECYACGGFFLDSGEFKVIRDTFMSEKEEEEYLQKLLKEIPEFQERKDKQEKDKARTEALKHYTKFLRLSYYMTGK